MNRNLIIPPYKDLETELKSYKSDKEASRFVWEYYQKRTDSIIVDLFFGQYKKTILCKNCNYLSYNYDTFNILELTIPNNSENINLDIYNCLDLYCEDEEMDCNCGSKLNKKTEIYKSPKILFIQFNRFTEQIKNESFIKYPINDLNLEKYKMR